MDNPATQTAVGPMVIVAVDQREAHPLIRDEFADRVLPGGTKALVALTRWPPLRRFVTELTEKRLPGIWASMLCRKRYIDDRIAEAVPDGVDAVVILGAGMDTRAYRLPGLAGIPVYEVDLPSNVARKRARLHQIFGTVPDHVTLVPTDFETEDLADALAAAGYQPGRRTFFVWEAVTQYLTEAGVRQTFDFLATAPAGSRLVFTYVRQDFLDGLAFYGAEAAHRDFVVKRRLWRFGMRPEQVAGFLADYAWREVEQAGPAEFVTRYLRPAGRDLPVSEIERSVYAEKT